MVGEWTKLDELEIFDFEVVGREGTIDLTPSSLVHAQPTLAFAIEWLEARAGGIA